MTRSQLPPLFHNATWRGLTPECAHCGAAILSFDTEMGPVRLYLRAAELAEVKEVLRDQGRGKCQCRFCATGVQSERSSGSPQVDGSTPEDGQCE